MEAPPAQHVAAEKPFQYNRKPGDGHGLYTMKMDFQFNPADLFDRKGISEFRLLGGPIPIRNLNLLQNRWRPDYGCREHLVFRGSAQRYEKLLALIRRWCRCLAKEKRCGTSHDVGVSSVDGKPFGVENMPHYAR